MSEWFSNVSAFVVFLSIAGIGFLFLLISLIFGEFSDFFHFDTDLDHGGPNFFSPRVLTAFVTAFGAVGAIAVNSGLSTGAASGAGVAGGFVIATLIYWFARFLYSQQASSDVRSADMVGQTGRIIVAIPAGGVGQIRFQMGEEMVDKIAQAHDGSAIPENSVVKVEQLLGETVIVRRQ